MVRGMFGRKGLQVEQSTGDVERNDHWKVQQRSEVDGNNSGIETGERVELFTNERNVHFLH